MASKICHYRNGMDQELEDNVPRPPSFKKPASLSPKPPSQSIRKTDYDSALQDPSLSGRIPHAHHQEITTCIRTEHKLNQTAKGQQNQPAFTQKDLRAKQFFGFSNKPSNTIISTTIRILLMHTAQPSKRRDLPAPNRICSSQPAPCTPDQQTP
jgi:hypothetical protein